MDKCEIFFSVDSQLIEFDIQEKGWRGDIIVKIGDEIFKPILITPTRLFHEFQQSINQNQIYDIEPNIILVEKTVKKTIINTIIELCNNGYFSKVKPIDLEQEYSLYSRELQEIKNWVKVY